MRRQFLMQPDDVIDGKQRAGRIVGDGEEDLLVAELDFSSRELRISWTVY